MLTQEQILEIKTQSTFNGIPVIWRYYETDGQGFQEAIISDAGGVYKVRRKIVLVDLDVEQV